MRVGIVCFGEAADSRPWMFISVPLAKQLVADGTHERLSKKKIRELAPHITPKPDPKRHCRTKLKIIIPKLNAPAPVESNLNLFYPIKDYSSYAKANFERIWGENCARIGNPIPY